MSWTCISNIASLATLITFLVLLTGKRYLIKARKNQIIQEFSFDYLYDHNQTDTYDLVIIDENPPNGDMFLVSSVFLRSITFYKICDDNGDPIIPRQKVTTYNNLPKNRLLQIKIRLPESDALYEIEAERDDYVIITREVNYNGTGYHINDTIRGRFTCRSYIYYLLS